MYNLTFDFVAWNSGYFGLGCSERCSSYCKYNDTCNHVSGVCPGGCIDGYIGGPCQLCKICTQLQNYFFQTDIKQLYIIFLTVCSYWFFYLLSILILILQLANLGITEQTVPLLVCLTVSHVDTQMGYVPPVRRVGLVIIAQLVNSMI